MLFSSSLHPQWEETLVFNEDINLFTSHPNLLFFEILDFPSSHHQHPMKKRQEVTCTVCDHSVCVLQQQATPKARHMHACTIGIVYTSCTQYTYMLAQT